MRKATGPASTSIIAARIAAAIFNDPTKVKFVPLTAKDRFTALQSGEVDVLLAQHHLDLVARHHHGLNFTGVNYYDGQGFMVRKALKVNSAMELNDAAVCVQQGTTTELNLADYFRTNKMKLKTVTFATSDEAVKAYDAGRCDAYTTDASALYAERLRTVNPDDQSCCRTSSRRSRWGRPCATATTSGSTSCAGYISCCSMPRSSVSPRPMSTRR